MLHLILGILKIIGILLLAVLGLLLLLVLALAFVPVRYELAGKKKKGATAARGKITWLLRLVSVTAGYRDGRLQVRLKLLGFTLFQFGTGGEKQTGGRGGRKKKKEPEAVSDIPQIRPENRTEGWAEPEAQEETEGRQQEPEAQEETGGGQQEPETVQKPEDELRQEADSSGSGSKEDASEDGSESGPDPEKKRFRGLAGILSGLWKRLCRAAAFLASLSERLLELPDKLQDFFWAADDRLERLSWRLESLRQRIEPYRTPESIALYKRLLWRLKYLWKHFGPRRLSGWLRFGTGAPDKTGQLAGLLYLILPASAEDFEVRPDFTEPVLEADLVIKGHIRACHLLRMAFGLWRDKELRKMIRRIKGGNENG